MKKTFLFLALMSGFLATSAQFIAQEILEKHSPSTIAKVYEVTLNTLIDHPTQLKLANILYEKDSLVMIAVKGGASLKSIKEIIDNYEAKFSNQFSKEDKIKYENYRHKSYIEAYARINTSYLRKKYLLSESLAKIFYSVSYNKGMAILKESATQSNDSKLSDSAFRSLNVFDTLYQGNLIALKGQPYFNAALDKLKKLKPFNDKQLSALEENYRLQCYRRGDDFHNNFNAALKTVTTDSVYYKALYEDSIKNVASKQAKVEIKEYMYKYGLNPSEVLAIKPIVEDKVFKNIWNNTQYPFSRLRDSLQYDINEKSWLKVKNKLIRLGYTALGTSRFTNTIRHKKTLNLSDAQIDTLADLDLDYDLMIFSYKVNNNGAIPNYSQFERIMLSKVLREGQYDTLINNESMVQAIANAKSDWNEIRYYNLANEGDSSATLRALVNYHKNHLVLVERYYLEPERYKILIANSLQNKPSILKRLEEAKKANTSGESGRLDIKL